MKLVVTYINDTIYDGNDIIHIFFHSTIFMSEVQLTMSREFILFFSFAVLFNRGNDITLVIKQKI